MRFLIILCLLGFMSQNSLGQGFQVKVKATHVVPDRKIYLEWINGRGQAIKVDSMLPNAQKEVNFKEDEIIIPDDVIGYIIDKYCNSEQGVRNLKRCLEIIYTKINLCRLIKPGTKMFDNNITLELTFPFTITQTLVDKLIIIKDIQNQSLKMMYI